MHDDLIRRLEAGERGRGISDECLLALGWVCHGQEGAFVQGIPTGYWRSPYSRGSHIYQWHERPNVTVSLDAALAHMVPEGWRIRVMEWPDPEEPDFAVIVCQKGEDQGGGPGYVTVSGQAPTAPAAIMVAVLRAMGGSLRDRHKAEIDAALAEPEPPAPET